MSRHWVRTEEFDQAFLRLFATYYTRAVDAGIEDPDESTGRTTAQSDPTVAPMPDQRAYMEYGFAQGMMTVIRLLNDHQPETK